MRCIRANFSWAEFYFGRNIGMWGVQSAAVERPAHTALLQLDFYCERVNDTLIVWPKLFGQVNGIQNLEDTSVCIYAPIEVTSGIYKTSLWPLEVLQHIESFIAQVNPNARKVYGLFNMKAHKCRLSFSQNITKFSELACVSRRDFCCHQHSRHHLGFRLSSLQRCYFTATQMWANNFGNHWAQYCSPKMWKEVGIWEWYFASRRYSGGRWSWKCSLTCLKNIRHLRCP